VSEPAAEVHTSSSVAETEAIAAALAERFRGGECVALHGDLGAGKTQFVRGLVRGLGGEPRTVSSPTFVLLNVYDRGRFTVYHLDAYRVHGGEDFEAIGFTELLDQPDGVVVVEWAERVRDLLPPGRTVHVRITPTGEGSRSIEINLPGTERGREI
jgi:tRNA threonylcarbamoyladenosine biosynthesis protein TsaE